MRSQIDSLNPSAREFYERSRLKLVLSIMIAAFGMMFLAMVAGSGASAAAVYKLSEVTVLSVSLTEDEEYSLLALRSGYGFQCFAALVAFFLSVLGALYFSPLYQTPNDKIAVKDPMMLAQLYPESGSTSSDPNKIN